MSKLDEIEKIADDYGDEANWDKKPNTITRRFIRELRKEKNMSLEEQARKIADDYAKKHNLVEMESPLDRIYEKSITIIEQEIHGETYRGKDVSKKKTLDILKIIIAFIALSAALKGAIDTTLLEEYKSIEKSKISDELTKEEQAEYESLKLKDLKGIKKIEKEIREDYNPISGSRKDGTHNDYANNDENRIISATDKGLDAAEAYIDQKIEDVKMR